MYNPDIHHRRSIRLKNYDYSHPGAYFITICVQDRQCLFGEIIEGVMQMNPIGNVAETCWQQIPQHFQNAQLDASIIMPNHVHGIVFLMDDAQSHTPMMSVNPAQSAEDRRGVQLNAPTRHAHKSRKPNNMYSQMSPQQGTLAVMIRTFKAAVTTQCRKTQITYMVWQRNYYEHIIRDERELGILREYILNNPKRWEIDQLHPNNPSKW